MEKMTQCRRIVQYMQKYGSITQQEAGDNLGCTRLASRIADLKKQGYQIRTVREHGENRYGEPTSYARYSLMEVQ